MEEALSRLKECDLEKAFKALQGKDRSGMRPWRRWSRVEDGRSKLVDDVLLDSEECYE